MPTPFSVDDFADKIDSLYRLVLVAARRANQLKTETHGFTIATRRKKPTVMAIEEVLDGKLGYDSGDAGDEDLLNIED